MDWNSDFDRAGTNQDFIQGRKPLGQENEEGLFNPQGHGRVRTEWSCN